MQLALLYKLFSSGPADRGKPFENQWENAISIAMKSMLKPITKSNKKSFVKYFGPKGSSETTTPSSNFVALWPHAGNDLKTNGNHAFRERLASA